MESQLPAYLIAVPLALALLTLFLGRWPAVSCGVGIVSALGVILLVQIAAPDTVSEAAFWTVANLTFTLTPFVAAILAFLAGGAALLFALQWLSPGPAAVVPGGLAALGLLAAALTVRPFAFGVVGLLAATAVVVPLLYGGRFKSAVGTWRAFLPVALAAPLLVGAGWLLDSGQAQGNAAQIALLLASLLLLGGFPFHIWLTGIAREAPLHALVLFLGLVGTGVAVWLGLGLDQFPVARGSTLFQTAVLGSALLSAITAAFGLGRAVSWRDVLAYGLVFDAGLQVAALTVPGPSLVAVLAVGMIGRLVALLLFAGAMAWQGTSLSEHSPASPDRSRLWLVYGGLALLGLPLTPSFAARWAALPYVAGQSALVLLDILLSMGLSAVAMMRWALVSELPISGRIQSATVTRVFVASLFFLALFMGLLGPYLLEYLSGLASG